MNTKQNHKCEYLLPQAAFGEAINSCFEKDGEFWVGNNEYASQVNYCPFCGEKAPIQTGFVRSKHSGEDDEMSEMDKVQLEAAFRDMPILGRLANLIENPPPSYKVH